MNPPQNSAESATPAAAIACIFGTGILFACLDTSAKYLVLSGMAAPFVSWTRFAVHVVLVLLLFRAWRNPAMFRVKSLPKQVLRGVFLFGSTFFNFLALKTLQLAETMSIFFFAPMLITALAGPLLGEWAGWRRWLAVGVLIITRPGFATFELGHVYAVCATLSYCFYVIMTRQMSAIETPESLIFYSACARRADAAGGSLHRLAAIGRLPLAHPLVARFLWRLWPLAHHQGLPHRLRHRSRALSLPANGLDDRLRRAGVRATARPLDHRRRAHHRRQRPLHRAPRTSAAAGQPHLAQHRGQRAGEKNSDLRSV